MAENKVSDELWEGFHRVVNMTSRELNDWLRARTAAEQTEDLPDQAGTETGQHVAHILSKRRSDLTDADIATMAKVVDRVHSERDDLEPTAGQASWRHRLMSIGHDPLKPTS